MSKGLTLFLAFLVASIASGQSVAYNRLDITTGISAVRVVIADFNLDGKKDIAYLLSGSGPETVSVLLGNGNGTFLPAKTTTLGSAGSNLAVGDFNNDGIPDLVADDLNNTSYVLLGKGDGTFQTKTIQNVALSGVAIGDFNRDGKPDLAVPSSPNTVSIYLGNGDGTFAWSSSVSTKGNGSGPVVAADLDGDGKLDLATVNLFSSDLSLLLGHGDGTFADAVLYPLNSSNPRALVVGDVNGDGIPDIVAAETAQFKIAVLLGHGDGTFGPPALFNVSGYVWDMAIADLNKDGKSDVVAATEYSGSNASVLLGFGNGTFAASRDFPVVCCADSVAVGDLDSDGLPDIVVAGRDSSITVLLSGPLPPPAPVLNISKTHSGFFTQGQASATFTIAVSNAQAAAATSGTVTVTDSLPAGLILDSMSGSGWTCSFNTCSRSDPLSPGATYPAITVTVDVQVTAAASLVNTASVSGGGSATAQASDTVNVNALTCTFSISPPGGTTFDQNGGTGGVSVLTSPGCSWIATSNVSWLSVDSLSSGKSFGTGGGGISYSVSSNPGAQRVGTLTVAGQTFSITQAARPLVVAPVWVSPGTGAGTTQTFTFNFQDSNGWADLAVLDVLTNDYLDGIGSCYFAVVPANAFSAYVYLVDDAGDGGYVSGTPMLVPSPGSLHNSQCSLNGLTTSITASGNTLILTVSITFAPSFAGNKIFYMAARSNTQNSGWQALGTWNVPGSSVTGPAVGGMGPGRSNGFGQNYTFTFTDTNGASDLAVVDVLTNSFLDGIGACYFAYVPATPTSGYLYLVDDAGDGGYTSGSPMAIPSNGTLANSQCGIYAAGSSATLSGNTLTLNLLVAFNSSFAGNQVFYLAARNNSTGNSGWQAVGSVTVP